MDADDSLWATSVSETVTETLRLWLLSWTCDEHTRMGLVSSPMRSVLSRLCVSVVTLQSSTTFALQPRGGKQFSAQRAYGTSPHPPQREGRSSQQWMLTVQECLGRAHQNTTGRDGNGLDSPEGMPFLDL